MKVKFKYIENVDNFVYLGSNVAPNASLDKEKNSRIGKASGTFARLTKRVWDNQKLSIRTKANVYRSCVCSTLKHGRCLACRRKTSTPFIYDAFVTT